MVAAWPGAWKEAVLNARPSLGGPRLLLDLVRLLASRERTVGSRGLVLRINCGATLAEVLPCSFSLAGRAAKVVTCTRF